MNPSKLADEILKKIKNEAIQPRSKWFFLAKNISFWALFAVATGFGAVSFAVILYATLNIDFNIGDFLENENLITYWITFLPLMWMLLVGVAVGLGIAGLKHTNRGYRIAAVTLIGSNVLGSVVLGSGFEVAHVAAMTELGHREAARVLHAGGFWQVLIVMFLGTEVVDGAAPQAKLNAVLYDEAEVPHRDCLEGGDKVAEVVLGGDPRKTEIAQAGIGQLLKGGGGSGSMFRFGQIVFVLKSLGDKRVSNGLFSLMIRTLEKSRHLHDIERRGGVFAVGVDRLGIFDNVCRSFGANQAERRFDLLDGATNLGGDPIGVGRIGLRDRHTEVGEANSLFLAERLGAVANATQKPHELRCGRRLGRIEPIFEHGLALVGYPGARFLANKRDFVVGEFTVGPRHIQHGQ